MQLTTRPQPRGRQPAMGRGMPSPRPRTAEQARTCLKHIRNPASGRWMPSPRPKRPQNCHTDVKRPAAYTAPTKGLGDATPPALPTPEANRSHKDAEHAPEVACSESTEATKLKKPLSATLTTAMGAASARKTTKAKNQASMSTRTTTWEPEKRLGEARCQQ